jgi:membrane fusion protein, copper/silver efflux system
MISRPSDFHATEPSPERGTRLGPFVAVMLLGIFAGGIGVYFLDLLLSSTEPEQPSLAAGSEERKIVLYRSPHDPSKTSPVPKKDEMGMDYLPVYADELQASAPGTEGLSAVTIDTTRRQLIGLKTAEVTRGTVGGRWRTSGRVVIDETRVRHVNLKFEGFVEHLYVDYVGKEVKRGDPLFAVYSPELYSAQQELLLALETRDRLAKGGLAENGEQLVRAANRKLELWDLPEKEIDRLIATGKPMKALTLYSPISGVVTKKDVVQGMRLDRGAMPLEITDLSSVWVLADIYESELRHVTTGMKAELTLKAFPGRTFHGKVAFIDPILNPSTRTAKVRLSFPNPKRELKPEMFGEVILLGRSREALRIPADAVIDSGTKKVVFVDLGEGKLRPQKIVLGDNDGENVEVLEGLAEGQRVVTRANFLVDSESRLKASLSAMAEQGGQ